jgi:hypothetical protein
MIRFRVYSAFIFGEKDRSSVLPDKGRAETHRRREVEGISRVSVWVLQGKRRVAGCGQNVNTVNSE